MQEEILAAGGSRQNCPRWLAPADIVSTRRREGVAEYLGSEFEKLGMQVEYQEVEEGRPQRNRHFERGPAAGATLMFNAHMDHFEIHRKPWSRASALRRGFGQHESRFSFNIEAVAAIQRAGVNSRATSSSPCRR